MFFILSKALLFLLSPFFWMMVFFLAAFFYPKQRLRIYFKWIALGFFLFFSNQVIFLEVCRHWEIPGEKIDQVKHYDIGIVLTGMAEYNNDLDVISIRRGGDRIWQALTLYHKKKIGKILITGDNGYVTDKGLHEAKQLKAVLIDWGIPEKDIITEEISRNTHENATETKKLIDRSYPHMTRFLLITSGTHMKRALACFKHENMNCTPFSTDLYTGPNHQYYWDQYLIPDASVFSEWNQLTKEMAGYVMYWIAGYI